MIILAIANQKGGVGKTATARELGAILAKAGRRVLLVDLDPQSSLTAACGLSPESVTGKSLADVLGAAQPGKLPLSGAIHALGDNLAIVPSDISLASTELGLTARMGRDLILKRCLASVAGTFDIAILDCPPSLGLLTASGLVAADGVIIPTQPLASDLRGVALFMDTLATIKTELNPELDMLGIVVTFYDSRLLHHQRSIEFINQAGYTILGTVGRSVRVADAAGLGQALINYDPGNPQALAYYQISEKVQLWLTKRTTGQTH